MPSKKNFKSANPALSFIGTEADEPTYDVYTDAANSDTHKQGAVSQAANDVYETTDTHAYTHKYTHVYNGREIKSRRLQLLIKPSTHAGVARLAERNGTSVNDVINTILENHLRKGE